MHDIPQPARDAAMVRALRADARRRAVAVDRQRNLGGASSLTMLEALGHVYSHVIWPQPGWMMSVRQFAFGPTLWSVPAQNDFVSASTAQRHGVDKLSQSKR